MIMLGSSHGGYLAHLTAKIAPYLVDAVIDNSSYAKILWRLVGFGKEIDFTDIKYMDLTPIMIRNICIYPFSKTLWTSNQHSKNFFSPTRRQIRNILEPHHLKIQSKYPKPYYVSYHSLYDTTIAPPQEKAELYKILKDLNFNARLRMICSANEIDGKFIKNLSHGMGMSLKTLILKELPLMLEILKQNPKQQWDNTSISYPCEDTIYHFSQKEAKMVLECEGLKK